MESKLVQKFVGQVNELITSDQEKNALFETLRKYQTSSDIKHLVQDLKKIVNEPSKLEVYDFIRPLIRPQHQQHYDKMTPNAPGQRLRVIKLRRKANESFGFAVRGGKEHGVGIFVSHVHPGSQADLKGLKMGDEIVRVNGFTIAEAIHEEVLNLIKGRDEIELKVTNLGMVPIKQNPDDPVSWQYVERTAMASSEVAAPTADGKDMRKIFINLHGAKGLGCSIISGPKQFPGIYIETVRAGSLGEDYGLEVGDQIVEVNGRSFLDIRHKEAIVELKGSKELNMIIRKAVGLPLLNVKKSTMQGGSPTPARPEQPMQRVPEDSDVLEEDLYAKVDKRRTDKAEQERLRKQQEEEQNREQELQRQREEEERELAAARRRADEEAERKLQAEAEERRKRELKEQQRQEAERRKQEAAAEEERRRAEAEQRRREQEEEEEQRREEILRKKQQSAVLSGRSGPSVSSMKPTLLGAASGSKASFGKTSKKIVKEVLVIKEDGVPLDIDLEGGSDSPLGGKIVVAEVFLNGAVDRNGGIGRGDQILKINKVSLDKMTLTEAQEVLWKAEQDCKPGGKIKFTVVESDIKHDDEMSDIVPSSELDYLDFNSLTSEFTETDASSTVIHHSSSYTDFNSKNPLFMDDRLSISNVSMYDCENLNNLVNSDKHSSISHTSNTEYNNTNNDNYLRNTSNSSQRSSFSHKSKSLHSSKNLTHTDRQSAHGHSSQSDFATLIKELNSSRRPSALSIASHQSNRSSTCMSKKTSAEKVPDELLESIRALSDVSRVSSVKSIVSQHSMAQQKHNYMNSISDNQSDHSTRSKHTNSVLSDKNSITSGRLALLNDITSARSSVRSNKKAFVNGDASSVRSQNSTMGPQRRKHLSTNHSFDSLSHIRSQSKLRSKFQSFDDSSVYSDTERLSYQSSVYSDLDQISVHSNIDDLLVGDDHKSVSERHDSESDNQILNTIMNKLRIDQASPVHSVSSLPVTYIH